MNDRLNNLPETQLPEIELQLRSFASNERVMALNQLAKLVEELLNMANVSVASLFVASLLGIMISLMTVSPSIAAPLCHTIQNQTVCILTIKRSAKNYWEYSAAVSIDGKRGRKEPYNCRGRYKTRRDGSIEYFDNSSIGTLVCKTYKPRRVGVPATLSMD